MHFNGQEIEVNKIYNQKGNGSIIQNPTSGYRYDILHGLFNYQNIRIPLRIIKVSPWIKEMHLHENKSYFLISYFTQFITLNFQGTTAPFF